MPDVLARVIGALCSELEPVAVAVGRGDQRLEDAVTLVLERTGIRIDLVEQPGDVVPDVTLLVVALTDSEPWAEVRHAVTLQVGDGAFSLTGQAVADLSRLLADYSDLRVEALERRLREQADELAELRARLGIEEPADGSGPRPTVERPDFGADPVAEHREEAAELRFDEGYDPEALAASLGWEGGDLAEPLPVDRRPPGDPVETVMVEADRSGRGLMRTAWSVLERATRPAALEIALGDSSPPKARRAAEALRALGPHIEVVDLANPAGGATEEEGRTRLAAGELVPPGWPDRPPPPRRVAFVLPGAPPGGSGGSHSVVQEVLGLNGVGVEATLVVPSDARPRIEATYPEVVPHLSDHPRDVGVVEQVGSAEVVIATEHTSVAEVVEATDASGALPAYYVQDYEAFFAPQGSERGDAAMLTYRARPDLRLFAKTHWLANLVSALHGVRVELVTPSVDRSLYHREGRPPAGSRDRVRVCALVRPRTPRRRPVATARLLAALSADLRDGVEIVSFGCAPEDLISLAGGRAPAWTHHGIINRKAVAGMLRDADIFIDLSVYQAFGRTGCEAMASGAVPVLPAVGGVAQYATDGVDSLLRDGGDLEGALSAVLALARDREQLGRLADAGAEAVAGYSIEEAGRSWAAALGAALAAR
jgi:glycosyltransferase involved in cell wall biosynthesis